MCWRKVDGTIFVDMSGESEQPIQIRFKDLSFLKKKRVVFEVENISNYSNFTPPLMESYKKGDKFDG